MGKLIVGVPADTEGGKLFLTDLRSEDNRLFIRYGSTYNKVGFQETEIFTSDNGENYVITGDDGTVLWRFNRFWIDKLKE